MTISIHTAIDEALQEADIKLYMWGKWVRSHPDIGYKKESIFGRMIREKSGAGHSGQAVDSMPPHVEKTEGIVLKMGPQIQQAIKKKYVGRVEDNDGAKRCRCNLEEYLRRVNEGVSFTARTLSEVP